MNIATNAQRQSLALLPLGFAKNIETYFLKASKREKNINFISCTSTLLQCIKKKNLYDN